MLSFFSFTPQGTSVTSSWNWEITSGLNILIVTGDSDWSDVDQMQNFNRTYSGVGTNVTVVSNFDFEANNFAMSDYDALLFSAIPGDNYFSTTQLNEIVGWYDSGGKLLWVTGDSDFAGGYIANNTSNDILDAVKSNLRIDAGTIEDPSSNDLAPYRVIANESGVSSSITDYVAGDFVSSMYHAPTAVNFYDYQLSSFKDLRNQSIANYNIDILVNSSAAAYSVDNDASLGVGDFYPQSSITGHYPMFVTQRYNGSMVVTSGEVMFSSYKFMYDLRYEVTQSTHDGAKLVDKLINYWFVNQGNAPGAELVERPMSSFITTTETDTITNTDTITQTELINSTQITTETEIVTNTSTTVITNTEITTITDAVNSTSVITETTVETITSTETTRAGEENVSSTVSPLNVHNSLVLAIFGITIISVYWRRHR